MTLLTNHPRAIIGLEGYGLNIVDHRAMPEVDHRAMPEVDHRAMPEVDHRAMPEGGKP